MTGSSGWSSAESLRAGQAWDSGAPNKDGKLALRQGKTERKENSRRVDLATGAVAGRHDWAHDDGADWAVVPCLGWQHVIWGLVQVTSNRLGEENCRELAVEAYPCCGELQAISRSKPEKKQESRRRKEEKKKRRKGSGKRSRKPAAGEGLGTHAIARKFGTRQGKV